KRNGHRALIVRQRRAVRTVKLPGQAPTVGAQRRSSGELNTRLIEMRNAAVSVGRIDGNWQRINHLAKARWLQTSRRVTATAVFHVTNFAVRGKRIAGERKRLRLSLMPQ